MQYPPIQQIKADLKIATDPLEIDFLEGLLVDMKYEAQELGRFYTDVMNEGSSR
jgi:hypothetical protein